MRLLAIFLLFCVILQVSESVHRVRKVVRNGNGIRRAVKDEEDILDIEAAELIFKEKGLNKAPFSVSEKKVVETEKPEIPIKNDPFASPNSDVQRTEPKIEKPIETPNGAPAFQPTIEELKESLVQQSTTSEPLEDVEGQESELITTTQIPFARQTIGPNGEIPFDFNIDPDFPKSAPIARGLVGIPDGWNINKQIDEQFKRGFRSNRA
ncbi:unnamed protein product [Caenorhabditis angaria]|uniref:Uncharacterized protein n=1 Tax=Caenorhabditis angaria TaxID=860376 RepID=A0A9P1MVI4_9PELO|nr:unnamed protein product [Caenorhabditis angaria]